MGVNVNIANFAGDPNIGMYGFATDSYCLIPNIKPKTEKVLADELNVKNIKTTLAGTEILSIFSVGNSNGVIVSELARKHEIEAIEKHTQVLVIKGKYTAIGNMAVANDKGCIISEKLKKYKGEIEDFLKVKATLCDIGGLEISGSITLATNKGCLVGKFATKSDTEIIKNALGVNAGFATANFGSSFVKSGIIANSNGAVIGEMSTSPEIQNISEILGFV